MSIRIFLFLWILLLPNIAQADSKVTAMTEDTTPSGTDLLYTVKDPATTPVSRRSTIRNVTEAGFNNAITANGTNIGVGTEDPQAKLDVNGAIYGRSNVGIGTAAPAAGLQVGPGSSSLGAPLSTTGALIKGNLEVDGKLYGDGSGLTNTPIPSGVVTSVTATYPVTSTGGTDPVISVDLTPYPQNTRTISTTPPLYGGGNLSADRIIYETRAGPATDGYLAATDWVTFNAKQPAGSYLTAESDPLALAKFGTLNTGKWCSSNGIIISCTEDAPGGGSVTSVTASAPVASSGGTTPNITISQASGSTNGYLSSGDWTTFNSKQAAGSYLTGVSTVYGLTGAGTIASPLQVDPNVYTPGGSQWITSGLNIYYNTGNVGIGSTAPQAALDLGSGSIFAGSGTFSGSGASTIYEGLIIPDGNLGIGTTGYGIAGLQVGSGAQALSAPLGETSALIRGNLEVDGKIYGDGSQLTNLPAGSGTVTSVTGSSPIASSGGTTPNITIAQSGSGTNGYLSSADWNTFNNKQPAGSYLTSESDTLETVTGRGASSTNNIGLGTTAPATTLQVGTGAKALSATLPSGSALVKGNLEVDGKIYGDGSGLTNVSGGASADNPTGTVGLTVVNGSASTFLRSDGAPPLSQAISPTWTGNHTFTPASGDTLITAGNVGIGSATPGQKVVVDGGVYLKGNIGIATSQPRYKLELGTNGTVPTGATPVALIDGDLVVDGKIYGDGSKLVGITGGGGISGLNTNRLVKAASDSTISTDTGIYHISPFIGIGIDAPLSTLHIKQGTATDGATLSLESTDTAVVANDILGKIYFRAVDAATRIGAFIQAKATGTWQDNDTDNAPTNIEFFTQDSSTSSTLGTPRMAILAAGNIGIGTVTPTAGLMVQVGAGAVDVTGGAVTASSVGINGKLYVDGGIYGTLWGLGGAGTYGYWSGSGTPVNIFNNNAGNVGIGVNPVNEKLGVEGKIFLRDGAQNIGVGINLPVYGASAAYNIDMVSNIYVPDSMTTAAYNVRSGYSPCISLTSGSYNICLGWFSGQYNTTTINSMFAGTFAGVNQMYGDKNYFLGYYNGQWLNDGSTPYWGTEGNTNTNNYYIGNNSTGYANDEANSYNVGNYVKSVGSNAITIGGSYTTKTVFYGNTLGLGTGAMNVGINSRSPLAMLDVEGSVYVGSTSGNVGIGDSTTNAKLDILDSGAAHTYIEVTNSNAGDYDAAIKFGLVDGTAKFTIGVDDSDSDKLKVSTTALGTSDMWVITSTGNMGIGSASPSANLDVDGGVYLQDASGGGAVRLTCVTAANRLGTCESSSACTTCTAIPNR